LCRHYPDTIVVLPVKSTLLAERQRVNAGGIEI
jgi:hypothetical protein